MKKLLSLVLALALCLCLTAPALAAGNPGDTTVTDAAGNIYTLSNPILYTLSRSDIEAIDMTSMEMFLVGAPYWGSVSDYMDGSFWPKMSVVYAVPEDTVVNVPDNLEIDTTYILHMSWDNGTCHITEFYVNLANYTSVRMPSSSYVVGLEVYPQPGTNDSYTFSGGIGVGSSRPQDSVGTIFFYVQREEDATENPFASSSIPSTSGGIGVTVNGKAVVWADAAPFIDANDRTMVPLRAVADAMGLEVNWDENTREASFTGSGKTIIFPIDSSTARTSEGGIVTMDTAAVIVNERTYAPIRYLAEFFGYTVGWDETARTVSITA